MRVLAARLVLALVLTIASLVPAAAQKKETPDQEALRVINGYRTLAGLQPVSLDAKLGKGCMEHASYMLLNRGTDAMAGLNAHHQDPKLPGATAAGAECGKAADLYPGVASLTAAIDGWMGGIYHRRPIMDPDLRTIAVGYAARPDGMLMAALMFVPSKERKGGWPVRFPGANQTDVLLEYPPEVPNPIPNNGKGGYPITLQFPPFDKVTKVSATLTANGKSLAFWLSDPEHPATSFGQYGLVSVIPKQVLAPNTKVTVAITATWNGKTETTTWSFTTLRLREVDAVDENAVALALGKPSLIRGPILSGAVMNPTSAQLTIGCKNGKRFTKITVGIPIAAWRELAGASNHLVAKGLRVEVTGTPQLVNATWVDVKVAPDGPVRFFKK
jgi:hypothetical protein